MSNSEIIWRFNKFKLIIFFLLFKALQRKKLLSSLLKYLDTAVGKNHTVATVGSVVIASLVGICKESIL